MKRPRLLAYSTALTLAAGLILLFLMVEVSSRPQFCGSCHVMTPYFESWKQSSHRDVDCVSCHIAPGVAHEVRKKWEALSMVASYFTGTYGTNPWTEIDDAACLQCHERRLLSGKELFGDILFDHGPHLTELRRGKKLRCTSCHSQIVQGEHIAVTTSTCILCHFKSGSDSEETSRCTLCHNVPQKVIEKGLLRFDHSEVSRFDMDCRDCHQQSAGPTDGAVPRERCFVCHNDQQRLGKYDETLLLHRMHVTDHKVDCMNCHLEIRHGRQSHEVVQLEQSNCSSCHSAGHSAQSALYAGVGGVGVPPMPAPMFLAGVACDSCHLELPAAADADTSATEIACMTCHGPRYRPVYRRWKDSVSRRTRAVRRQFAATERLFPAPGPQPLADARHNLEMVERGDGVHNPRFASALLSAAHDSLNSARREIGRAELPAPWPRAGYDSPCRQCHDGIEEVDTRPFGRNFSHGVHVVDRGIECRQCHPTHEERREDQVLKFGPEGCASCHHGEPEADCASCHSTITERTVASFRGDFEHSVHTAMVESCTDCHTRRPDGRIVLERDFCSACH